MTEPAQWSDKQGVNTLVKAAIHFGVEHVVICPGSRNAPIVIAFNRCGYFKCMSIADERVAGFYALGLALATGRPVAVTCTSGSAVINLAPAVAEANYLGVPLIAITADRPLAWTDQGHGQTIRQQGVFANFTRFWFNLCSEPANDTDHWQNHRMLSEAFNTALQLHPGPVHINVPLSEPLYHSAPPAKVRYTFYEHARPEQCSIAKNFAARSAVKLNGSKRIMILAGQMPHGASLRPILEAWAGLPNAIVLSESTSNLCGSRIITTIDRLIVSVYDEEQLSALMPDVLITIGGFIVSKKIKALLSKFRPAEHWHITYAGTGLDTFQSLSLEMHCDAAVFLKELYAFAKNDAEGNYAETWSKIVETRRVRHQRYLDNLPFTDFKVFQHILELLPQGAALHMANSSPVRYVQLFEARPDVHYWCNRGTSGIDGCTSTAAGWALARPDVPVVLVTGDMAFMYDSNALWNRDLPKNLKIIVVNNQGGGIFRIIDGPASADELEDFFEAYHPAAIERIAQAFDLPYYRAGNEGELLQILPRFYESTGCTILEVLTPRYENAPALKSYFQALRD